MCWRLGTLPNLAILQHPAKAVTRRRRMAFLMDPSTIIHKHQVIHRHLATLLVLAIHLATLRMLAFHLKVIRPFLTMDPQDIRQPLGDLAYLMIQTTPMLIPRESILRKATSMVGQMLIPAVLHRETPGRHLGTRMYHNLQTCRCGAHRWMIDMTRMFSLCLRPSLAADNTSLPEGHRYTILHHLSQGMATSVSPSEMTAAVVDDAARTFSLIYDY